MMRQIFDTSKLITFWRRKHGQRGGEVDAEVAKQWATELISVYRTNRIVTPVELEFLAGARTSQELQLFLAFLNEFESIDKGVVIPKDWEIARNLARRIPADGRPRQLGDCLIAAIARRLRHLVITSDSGFPQ